MIYLLTVSVVWAFSFGLIGKFLKGVDSNFVAWVRLILSLVIFLPFFRVGRVRAGMAWQLLGLGGIQYGLMYMTYIYSFRFLPSHQVALFTIFTPFFVMMFHDLATKRFHAVFFLTAAMAVAGAALVAYSGKDLERSVIGFLAVQVSNVCFAFGQVRYRDLMASARTAGVDLKDRDVFALMYLGAVILTTIPACATTPWSELRLGGAQVWTLLYLGVLPSGICFFLWNLGAKKVNAGTLAVLNNAKIPLGVLCSILIFHESARVVFLTIGAALILAALAVNERYDRMTALVRGTPTGP